VGIRMGTPTYSFWRFAEKSVRIRHTKKPAHRMGLDGVETLSAKMRSEAKGDALLSEWWLPPSAGALRASSTARLAIVGCGQPGASVPVADVDDDAADIAVALQTAVLATTGLGLRTCWIGASHEDRVKVLLTVPEEARVIALRAVRVADESPPARGRNGPDDILHDNTTGAPH
jgi:nitroreductase